LFWRLTIIADDHGRFDANPMVMRARCFPLMIDKITTEQVMNWLNELSEPIEVYEVVGRRYGRFRNWAKYQRVYGSKSKFPDPPGLPSGNPPGVAGNLRELPGSGTPSSNLPLAAASRCSYPISDRRDSRNEYRYSSENRQSVQSISPKPGGFDEFWNEYPLKTGKRDAEAAWRQLNPSPELLKRIIASVFQWKKSVEWTRDDGRWIPGPAKWLSGHRWKDEPRPRPPRRAAV
jgi:hypothetical protein